MIVWGTLYVEGAKVRDWEKAEIKDGFENVSHVSTRSTAGDTESETHALAVPRGERLWDTDADALPQGVVVGLSEAATDTEVEPASEEGADADAATESLTGAVAEAQGVGCSDAVDAALNVGRADGGTVMSDDRDAEMLGDGESDAEPEALAAALCDAMSVAEVSAVALTEATTLGESGADVARAEAVRDDTGLGDTSLDGDAL